MNMIASNIKCKKYAQMLPEHNLNQVFKTFRFWFSKTINDFILLYNKQKITTTTAAAFVINITIIDNINIDNNINLNITTLKKINKDFKVILYQFSTKRLFQTLEGNKEMHLSKFGTFKNEIYISFTTKD